MKSNACTASVQGGAILEKPAAIRAIFGFLGDDDDDDTPRPPKCGFTPL